MEVAVWFEEEGRDLMVKVKDVQVVGCINVTEDIVEWASSGRSGQVPQNALQALDVVLNEAFNLDPNIYNIGRSYFHMDGTTMDLGFGKEVWAGDIDELHFSLI